MHSIQQPDEYETDSDTAESDEEDDFEVVLQQDMHDQISSTVNFLKHFCINLVSPISLRIS